MQNFEKVKERISHQFEERRKKGKLGDPLKLSWSNWGFGQEPLEVSLKRLAANGIHYIELHGNRYGNDLGYDAKEVLRLLEAYRMKVSGICGMFSPDNDLSSNVASVRQRAIDYIRRNLELAEAVGAQYFLIVPGAVGRNQAYDSYEFDRSVDALQRVADAFVQSGVVGAVEPIRSAEVSFCHTLEDAMQYIRAVDHPGIRKINADIYHMYAEEANPYQALADYGEHIANLHLADTNRRALGQGCLDVDTMLKALYGSGFSGQIFCTAEPLGPGGDPYPAMYGRTDAKLLDALVSETASTFYQRNAVVLDKRK